MPLGAFLDFGAGLRATKLIRVLRLVRLFKLMRLLKLGNMFEKYESFAEFNTSLLPLLKMIGGVWFVGHLIACFWFYMTQVQDATVVNWWQNTADGTGANE